MIDFFRKVKCWSYVNMVRILNLTELYQPSYNRQNYIFLKADKIKRDSDDRVRAIQDNIVSSKVSTYLDIGSQLGYFVLKLSELNKFTDAQGFEMNQTSCAYANALVCLNNVNNVSFINCKVTHDLIHKTPSFDMISFLNVFHHIVHFEGFDEADAVMRELYNKTNEYFIFETGQFDEKGYYWTDSLSFMGANPVSWIHDYLIQIGYKSVEIVNNFPTHLSGQTRAFLVCRK